MNGYARVNLIVEGHTEETFARDIFWNEPSTRRMSALCDVVGETGKFDSQRHYPGLTQRAFRIISQDMQELDTPSK